ncbi:hypothetical protein A5904_10065 [Acidithiobacillus caldus]|uniref:Uncharacterized protein n=1 Tax=Acidithiobacillus caldus (strain SM-1) TaxID=990288 RepID=F9ZQN8_ACICS|nr:hypothetical protein [Acidithiobacillus caldus]AEK58638.1 conserved hypothetical protein [Acidithiobacillus caldus SM-1]AUW33196.1 hypothetical protein A5904_10065 [Acidithiobacillus caldus]MBU2801540.1 hypothetical protein [Acidithiobacillus caldus]QER45051.1 hypothetical protein F0726_01992 [Acidithiobacillus caldus]
MDERRRIPINGEPSGNPKRDEALAAVMPEVQAGLTLERYVFGGVRAEAPYLIREIREQVEKVNEGDMTRVEAMLVSQMVTLDRMFNDLSRRAMSTTGMEEIKLWLTGAMRAQRQCTQAAEALAQLKNPTVFVAKAGQVNQSSGPMQVNNGTVAHAPAESDLHGELKEVAHEQLERMDPGTPGTSGRVDPAMATVGEVHRPTKRSRKSKERG